jgi:hypothetical protein
MDTLSELRAEHAKLGARIAALEAGQRPHPDQRPAGLQIHELTPPKQRGVEVRVLLDEQTDGMPDLRDLRRLFDTMKGHSPWPIRDEDRAFSGFRGAFRWIMSQGRIDAPNPKFSLSYYCDACRAWLKDRNAMSGDIVANSVMLAAMAAGDVHFVLPNAALGHVAELGLHGTLNAGRRADMSAWRQVLERGAPRSASAPSRPAAREPVHFTVRV